jgi:hypothetical protein
MGEAVAMIIKCISTKGLSNFWKLQFRVGEIFLVRTSGGQLYIESRLDLSHFTLGERWQANFEQLNDEDDSRIWEYV